MATFAELLTEVYTVTKRPDLVAETTLAVKAATLKLHQSDFYYKDLFETGISFTDSSYLQQLEIKPILPRYRALKYLRRYDNSGSGMPAEFFTILTPTQVLDEYGLEKSGIAYMAGSTLNIRSAVAFQFALLGVYLNPSLVESNFISWIADDHPYAIVFEALRLLFKQIGYDEQAAAFERLAGEQLAEVKMAGIQVEGY